MKPVSAKACLMASAVATALLTFSGCSSTGGLLQGERIDYQSATKKNVSSTLDVPPDLSQLSRDNRYSIPQNGSNGPLTASSYNAKSAATVATSPVMAATPVAPMTLQDMRIERDGSQRWLLVKQNADVVWPKIKEFWQDNGFVISEEKQSAGVMETDWAENRAKIPQDILRSTLGAVFDSLYSTGERDKFRTRLERRTDGSTEIYISHRGVEEVLVGTQKDSTKWTVRPNDPALEATFLSRLMVSLGTTPEKAKEILNSAVMQPVKAKLVKEAGASVIDMDEAFDHAWRRVGLALDRIGFTVEDRDRNAGFYFVRYLDQDADGNKDGLFSKLFSFGDKEKEAKRYRITVKGDGNVSHVSVQKNDGSAENTQASEKMLNLLLEQLK